MKNIITTSILLVSFAITIDAQEIINLYDGTAPGSEEWDQKEIEWISSTGDGLMIRNVVDPTLTVFKPDKSVATGTAVVVCPGGGNFMLSYENEGTKVAKWLTKKGITAFVLKYRLLKTPEDNEGFMQFVVNFFTDFSTPSNEETGKSNSEPSNLWPSGTYYGGEDGLKAIEYVRNHATELGIDPNKVGIIGFSAGAMVTMHVILNSNPEQHPNFAAPIYGGWLFGSEVPKTAPPLFIAGAADDQVSSSNPDLYKAWRNAGLEAELHMYSKGGHGFGMKKQGLPIDNWIDRYYEWLKNTGF